jgi:PEP-CTERM motif
MKTLRETFHHRRVPLAAAISLIIATIALVTSAQAGSLKLSNFTANPVTYDISFQYMANGMTVTYAATLTLAKNGDITYGGKGASVTESEISNPKVFKAGVQIVSLLPALGDTTIAAAQTAQLLEAADGTSSVFSFFDFQLPNFEELTSNTDFTFGGLAGNGTPILLQAGTTKPITEGNGQLLPQFAFTGPTTEVGLVTNPPFVAPVPEPQSVGLVGIGLVGIGLAFYVRRRHSAFELQR